MDQDLQDGDFNDEDSDGDDDEGVLNKRVKSWFKKVISVSLMRSGK